MRRDEKRVRQDPCSGESCDVNHSFEGARSRLMTSPTPYPSRLTSSRRPLQRPPSISASVGMRQMWIIPCQSAASSVLPSGVKLT